MTLRDENARSPLTFLSERLLQALQTVGDDGLGQEELDALNIPQLDWRLNELRTAGYVIGEQQGWYFLVHSPTPGADAASTGPSASTGGVPPAAGAPSRVAGGPVDAAPCLFDEPLREAA